MGGHYRSRWSMCFSLKVQAQVGKSILPASFIGLVEFVSLSVALAAGPI